MTSHIMATYETIDYILCCFVKRYESSSYINLQIIDKSNGDCFEKIFPDLKGVVAALKIACLGQKFNEEEDGLNGLKLSIIVGTHNGKIKII